MTFGRKRKEVKYEPDKKFMQVLNKTADEIKTYPIKEGSSLYKAIGRTAMTQLMRIDDENTLLCFNTDQTGWHT